MDRSAKHIRFVIGCTQSSHGFDVSIGHFSSRQFLIDSKRRYQHCHVIWLQFLNILKSTGNIEGSSLFTSEKFRRTSLLSGDVGIPQQHYYSLPFLIVFTPQHALVGYSAVELIAGETSYLASLNFDGL